ncbi:tetraacyldisaccharide 4'-kinase [Woodsholea maritima]|uniref:tetraacyldisaccharide 4'-kinase n=1 Tax=Woodsholea maritima TaxID=240237 RepID=UPI0003707922|nr:tetraacyldisaccharide 4'-kinase [Woodsholea maritima]
MRAPSFWSADEARGSARLTRALLSPLGYLYAWGTAHRIATTKPHKAEAKVICVGNLTMGGTGKTPLTARLMEILREMGHRPASLSRGYGGHEAGPLKVDLTRHTPRDVGDEPCLLARTGEAYIARERPAGADLAAHNGADVIIMDDGHQNPTLYKNYSIVVVDGQTGWGPGPLFPAGPLREPVQAGLARADMIIVMGPDDAFTPPYRALGLEDLEKPILRAWLAPTSPPPEGPLLAFAGIGRPQKVFDALTRAGANLVEAISFPDHHPYSEAEIARLLDLAEAHQARLITTEKDWVRLSPAHREAILTWPVRAEISHLDSLTAHLRTVMDAPLTLE